MKRTNQSIELYRELLVGMLENGLSPVSIASVQEDMNARTDASAAVDAGDSVDLLSLQPFGRYAGHGFPQQNTRCSATHYTKWLSAGCFVKIDQFRSQLRELGMFLTRIGVAL